MISSIRYERLCELLFKIADYNRARHARGKTTLHAHRRTHAVLRAHADEAKKQPIWPSRPQSL